MTSNNLLIQSSSSRLRPVQPGERILALDVMRGFALFGVLLAYALWNLGNPPEESYSQINTVYCRRLFGLLLIGLAHALLLRNGDILVPYAVMGLFLLVFRRASKKTLVIAGIIGVLYPYFARSAWDLTGIPFPQRPEADGASYLAENYAWVRYWYSTANTSWPASLPMFFFGLYLGRRRFFENIGAHARNLSLGLAAGLGISSFLTPFGCYFS